jgi:hypothetical protein
MTVQTAVEQKLIVKMVHNLQSSALPHVSLLHFSPINPTFSNTYRWHSYHNGSFMKLGLGKRYDAMSDHFRNYLY